MIPFPTQHSSWGASEPDRERRVRILKVGTMALVGLGAVAIYQMWTLGIHTLVVALFLACGAGILNLVWLARGAPIERAGNVGIAVLFALLLTSVSSTGGFYDPNFSWLFAVPMAAALIVGVRTSLVWAALVAVTTCVYWHLPASGFEVPNLVPVEARHGHALFNRLSLLGGLMILSISFAITQRRTEYSLASRNRALRLEAVCVRLLQHAAVAANESDDFDAAIDTCAGRVLENSSWDVALCWEPDPNGAENFRWLGRMQSAGEGAPDALLQGSRRLVVRSGELALGRVLATAEPSWAFGEELDPDSSPRGRAVLDAGMTTALAIPIVVRGRVVRILEFFGHEVQPPDARLIDVLCEVGRQLGRVAERVQLQESVRRSQKLESVGQLAAGIAHEISNPMAYVRANLGSLMDDWREIRELLKAGADADAVLTRIEACEELIAESQDGVDRTVAIVSDVRDFARDGAGATERVRVIELVESAIRIATSAKPAGATVEVEIDEALEIEVLATRVRQVILNLVMNAMQAMGPGGRLRITGEKTGRDVGIRIEDDGHGIAPADLEHIFEPFFTTKAVGQGTGLGLYISHEITRWHGGTIDVESTPGRGSAFTVWIPRLHLVR